MFSRLDALCWSAATRAKHLTLCPIEYINLASTPSALIHIDSEYLKCFRHSFSVAIHQHQLSFLALSPLRQRVNTHTHTHPSAVPT